jgi:hypothetical protein
MGPVEQQAERHTEAYRRAHPNREIFADEPGSDVATNAGLHIGPANIPAHDTWSSGGAMPGVTTPDNQGPENPFGRELTESPRIDIGRANTEDIVRGGRR